MEVITIINKAVTPKKGNKPNFDEAHVLLALDIINKEQPIGRHLLMKRLNLSEATTRTLIKRLKELQLINIDKIAGILLTENGKKIIEALHSQIKIIDEIKIDTINWETSAVIINNGKSILDKIGILQMRDLIIKAGAEKVLIAVIENNTLELPPKSFNESEEVKKLKNELKERIGRLTKDGDLIVFFEPKGRYLAYKILTIILEK